MKHRPEFQSHTKRQGKPVRRNNMATDGEFSLAGIDTAAKQGDGSWHLTQGSTTVIIPASMSDNSGGVDAWFATNGSSNGDSFWDRLEKIRKKIWS